MKLIEFDGLDFTIADEALLVAPIRELFRADKSRKKEDFWKQISYLWFMCDPRSSYMYILDEDERSQEVAQQEGLGAKWKPSETLKKAMEVYKRQTTTTASLLLADMRASIEDVRFILRELGARARQKEETTEENGKKGKKRIELDKILPVMSKSIREIPDLAKALVEAEKALAKDFASEDKVRGTTNKAAGEDI